MKLLIAMNDFFSPSIGMAVSAQRSARELSARGVEVRILSGGMEGKPDYPLKRWKVPLYRKRLEAQHLYFAHTNAEAVREAVSWADLVHTWDPFPVSHQVLAEAYRQGKPRVGSFRFFPENLTYGADIGGWDGMNHILRTGFREYIYNYCDVIVCPSRTVRKYLNQYAFRKGRPELVPTGIPASAVAEKIPHEGFRIFASGRLTAEKDHRTLLQAVRQSRYADRIYVTIAGTGPAEAELQKEGSNLPHPAKIRPMRRHAWKKAAASADLYVQSSLVETEGLACIESFAAGCVPVIADAPLSASREHAVGAEHLYAAGDPAALAAKIDWWIEHPVQRKDASGMYRKYAETFTTARQADRLMRIYEDLTAPR